MELDKEQVVKNKKRGIQKINKLLEEFISSDDTLKKANLISYWLQDYTRMIEFEKKFSPTKNISYKHGDIVKVNFGFRIGSECGGLHYAVVIDINNHHNSPVVTVIPLTSKKDNNESSRFHNIDLGDELYKLLKIKSDTLKSSTKTEVERVKAQRKPFLEILNSIKGTRESTLEFQTPSEETFKINSDEIIPQLTKIISSLDDQLEELSKKKDSLKKIQDEIIRMKKGSVAIINQITTISKIRIQDPRNSHGVLAGIRISSESLDKIDSKIKEVYTNSK